MKKWLAAIAASLIILVCALAPALAQWQVPTSSVPVGRGAGVTGFNSVGPTANTILNWGSGGTPQAGNIITGENYNAAMTNSGEAFGYSFRNTTTTGNDIYAAVYPGVSSQVGLQGVLNVPATTTVTHAAAIGAYFDNQVAASGGGRSAVGLFSVGRCRVDGSNCWGINTLLMDATSIGAGAGTGRILLNEFDYNVQNPDTQVIGLSVGGEGTAQSNNAIAFIANSLGSAGYKWQTGFYCIDAAVSANCLVAGPTVASGTSTSSTKVLFQYFNGASVKKTTTLQADTNRFIINSDDAGLNLSLGSSGSQSGSLTFAGGTSGAVTVQVQSAAGSYNFNLPTSAGSSGQPLLSAGGGSSPMTFGTLGVGAGGTGLTSGTSGGVLYYSASNTLASSGALAANTIVKGGGAGAAPTTANSCGLDANQSINCASSTSFNPAFNITNTTNDANYPNLRFIHGRSSATGLLQADDAMGALVFAGGDGSSQVNAVSIIGYVDGTPGAGDMPSRIVFSTTPDGSSTQAEAMRITHKKHMAFSGTAPTLSAGCNGAGSSVSGTNVAGTVTGQTAAATTCTLTFANSGFSATQHCVVSGQNSPLTGAFTPSTTTIVVNFASTASYKWSYVCFGI